MTQDTPTPVRPTVQPQRAAEPQPQPQGRPLDSAALLRGERWVEIHHNGEIYRLQSTRLGKLILTK